ncbi:MAG: aspartate kinase [Anaerolineaceae bacterium]|jgi:aspartate kinase
MADSLADQNQEFELVTDHRLLVMKFGGTSVGTLAAMRQVVQIIAAARVDWPRLVIVTSALSEVTDLLIQSAIHAAHGDMITYNQAAAELNERHLGMVTALVADPVRQEQARLEICHLLADFNNLCQAIHVLGEATPRALDAVASLGERMSVRILAAALEDYHLPAQPVEATQLILTDNRFQNALPDMPATTRLCCQVLSPMLENGLIPVVTGFIGATPEGLVTTLGRGGSDFTASILGVVLQASEVWIWTDVDGIMTADPRLVSEARSLPVLSYREVAEMAHFGAKVLQPRSIYPVIEAGIPVRVCNTFNPTHPGTRLVADKTNNGYGTVKAMAALRGLQLVTLSGRGMLGVPGVAGRIFSAAATTGVSIPLIIESTSEQTICFAVPREMVKDVLQALHRDLHQEFERRDIDQAYASEDIDIITLVCPGLRSTPGIAGQIFGRLGSAGINVLAISYGASDISINLVVSAADTRAALQTLHSLTVQDQG